MIARRYCRGGSINMLRSAAYLSSVASFRPTPSFTSKSTTCFARRTPTLPTLLQRNTVANRSSFATMSVNVPYVTLNDGNKMPQVGFGLWKVDNATCADTVYNAIKAGYRLFDGACGM